MMHTLIQPFFILVLFVLIRSADLAISAGVARDTLRAIAYAVPAVLALLYVVFNLF